MAIYAWENVILIKILLHTSSSSATAHSTFGLHQLFVVWRLSINFAINIWFVADYLTAIRIIEYCGACCRHAVEYCCGSWVVVGGGGWMKSTYGGGSDCTAFKSLENFVSGTLTAITYALSELASVHYGIRYNIMM